MNFYITTSSISTQYYSEKNECVVVSVNENSNIKTIKFHFPFHRFVNYENKTSEFIQNISGTKIEENTFVTEVDTYHIYDTFYKTFY